VLIAEAFHDSVFCNQRDHSGFRKGQIQVAHVRQSNKCRDVAAEGVTGWPWSPLYRLPKLSFAPDHFHFRLGLLQPRQVHQSGGRGIQKERFG
jgi:hypothetical protein